MARAARKAGFWQSLRELPDRTPLRVKMMSAVLALVTIALVVISVAGIQILKANLLSPYDSALETNFGGAVSHVGQTSQTAGPAARGLALPLTGYPVAAASTRSYSRSGISSWGWGEQPGLRCRRRPSRQIRHGSPLI